MKSVREYSQNLTVLIYTVKGICQPSENNKDNRENPGKQDDHNRPGTSEDRGVSERVNFMKIR